MKQFILSLVLVLASVLMMGQEIAAEHVGMSDEAQALFESKNYKSAGEKYSQLLSIYPQNVDFNFKFGVCSVENGTSPSVSIRHLEYACSQNSGGACYYYLGKAYHLNYDFEQAISSFLAFKSEASSKDLEKYDVDQQISMCTNGKTLMKNVKDLVVMDKKESGLEDFYRYYELTGMGGKLLAVPEELKSKYDKKVNYNGVLFFNGKSNEVYFASYGSKGNTGRDIYKALILPNGKYSEPQKIPGTINTIFDEDYPFVHPDGKSLYFSSTGHSSMGGFDVFRADFNLATGKFSSPVNLDFAVNTPDDDILYVTDSLHQEAWFASGRNIATDRLNIYNVKVKGIPMNLTFLKGLFAANFDENLKGAHIIVKDELTGREVYETFTDAQTGEYIISINKPGLYKFQVNADNSPVTHEGLVQIPVSETSMAYSQELNLIKESSQEKLIIHNNFDTPLQDDIATLSAEFLRRKSSLDINADEIEEELDNPTVSIEKVISNATIAAGFKEGTEISEVIEGAQDDIKNIENEVGAIEENNSYAYAYAVEMQELSKEKMKEARDIRENADPSNESEFANKMIQADRILLEADELALNSKAAMRIAQRASGLSASEISEINAIEANVIDIIEGELNQDFDRATEALRWEKDRINSKKGITAVTPGDFAREESNKVEEEQEVLLASIEVLSDSEKTLNAQIKRNEENISREKKSSKLELLQSQNIELNSELTRVQSQLVTKRAEAQILGKEQKLLNKEVEFYANKYITPDKVNLNPIDLDSPLITEIEMELEDLDEAIEDSFAERKISRANGDYEIRGTSFAVDQNLADNLVEDKLSDQNVDESLASSSDKELINEAVSVEREIEDLENQVASFDNGNPQGISDADILLIKDDLSKAQNRKSAIQSEMQFDDFTEDDALLVYNELEPNYRGKIQNIISDSDNEIEQSIDIIQYKKEVRDELKFVNDNIKRRIKTETDPDVLADLLKSNYEYEEAYQKLTDEIYDVNPIRAAFESENKTIVESDELIAIKLNDQIALTDQFINGIDQVIDNTNSEITKSSDPVEKSKLLDMVNVLNDERDQAIDKLNTYQSDLALTTSTEDAVDIVSNPVTNNSDDRSSESKPNDDNSNPGNNSKSSNDKDDPVNGDEDKNETEKEPYITPVGGGTFNEVFADAGIIKPEDSYNSDEYFEFYEKTMGSKWEIDNVAEMERLDDELYNLESEYQSTDSKKRREELDTEIEKKFMDLSKMEFRNYARMHHFTADEMKANAIKIDSLKTMYDALVQKSAVKGELKRLTKDIDLESNELEVKRKQLPDLNDDIEQAFVAREAFALESSIIRKQRKIIALYENTPNLNTMTDEEILAMNRGRYGLEEVPEVEIVLNKGVDIDWNLIENEESIQPYLDSPMFADIQNKDDLRGLDAEYVDRLRVVELRLSEQGLLIQERNELMKEADDLEAQIEELEYKIANTKKKKEKEALEAEMQAIIAQADVTYDRINYLNSKIDENNTEIAELVAENELADNDIVTPETNTEVSDDTETPVEENVTEKTVSNDPSEVVSNEPIDNQLADTNDSAQSIDTSNEVNQENFADNGSSDVSTNVNNVENRTESVSRNVSSVSTLRTGSAVYRSEDMLNFPEVLTVDIFNMHPDNSSQEKDIPKDVKLPSGVIYKVQVGAFRNPIRSSVFKGFSPVSGEELSNGITRYTAGLFVSYANAEEAKQAIRKLGYSDAFIVKFVDGKRAGVTAIDRGEDIAQNSVPSTSNTSENKTTGVDVPKVSYPEGDLAAEVKSDPTGKKAEDYYNSFADAAKANIVESIEGVFFTVQVGVYSRPVPVSELKNIDPVNAEMITGGKYRYSTGIYDNLNSALKRRDEIRVDKFADAFVTAYYNGQRITVAKAKELLSNGETGINEGNAKSSTKELTIETQKTNVNQTVINETPVESSTNEVQEAIEKDNSAQESAPVTPRQNETKVETISLEMETPVVVRTTVNQKSEGPSVKLIQMEYDILLYSSDADDFPSSILDAIDNFGSLWDIKTVQKGEKKLVHTKRVKTLQEARNIQNELKAQGVSEPEIRAFRVE